jgi:hypothetical protein
VKRLVLIAVVFVLIVAAASAQDETPTPEEYTEEEFSEWLHDLRRAEIVLVGSFPITMFVTVFAYDIIRYASNEFQPEYAPWPFKGPNAVGLEDEERRGVLIAGVSISGLLALADFLLGMADTE